MSLPVRPDYVAFDETGAFVDRPGFDAALAAAEASPPTDVFVFSHGWKNSFVDASSAYAAVMAEMSAVADARGDLRPDPFRPLTLGVIWPSKAWDDDGDGELEGTGAPPVETMAEAVYDALSPDRASPAGFRSDVLLMQQLLLKDRLDGRERAAFRDLLRRHADRPLVDEDESIFEPEAPASELEGATAGDFSARDVFRTFTYWQMKKRAGVVGQTGVRAAVSAAQDRFPAARVHLVGHSFGCKVVLAAVAGPGEPTPRPVQTVVLLQGAVSFEALAANVTGTTSPGGYRAALDPARLDGPIVATFSAHDSACVRAYPLGSRLAGHVGELEGLLDRFRALGAVGSRGVEPDLDHRATMQDVGGACGYSGRGVWSVDGGTAPAAFITGHSDILTPQVAWLIWNAVLRR